MRVSNNYKRWVQEDYDVAYEDYYTTNVEYEYSRAWSKASLKHGLLSLLFAIIIDIFFNLNSVVWSTYWQAVYVLTASFILYGIATYVMNREDLGQGLYLFVALFGLLTFGKLPPWQQVICGILSLGVYIGLTFVLPIYHHWKYKDFKKVDIDEESGRNAKEEQAYQQWKNGYNANRKGLPSGDGPKVDPAVAEARRLFEGYTGSPQQLKTRYRQLAKQYHPDMLGEGADDSMFKAIRYVYEELQNKVGKA